MSVNMLATPSACIAVFERQPYWGPELQRQLAGRRIVVRECRTLRDLLPATEEFPRSVIVLVLEAGPGECVDWLRQHFLSEIPRIVVAPDECGELESPLREADAVFMKEDDARSNLAPTCVRHLQNRNRS